MTHAGDSGTLGREGMLGRTARQELAEVDGAGMEQRQGLRNLYRLSLVVSGYVHRHSLQKGTPKGDSHILDDHEAWV